MQSVQIQNENLIVSDHSSIAKSASFSIKNLLDFNALSVLDKWLTRREHRRHLMQLPDYLLEDIGLTRKDVVEESNKAFWEKGLY